ncbi:phage protein [Photobacterium aphoticum]|uniref:Phage protein n=1 Tax=Photobacterium aphoticum TaxID=754436 RepID=A0A090QYK3_9GAMM|nr:phage protein [Photobacterium aphoticum]
MGLKISPSTGTATITNNGTTRVSLPMNTSLASNDLVDYVTMAAVELQPAQSADIPVFQMRIDSVVSVVTESKKWMEVLLSRDMTEKAHQVDVYVNGQLWEKRFKFRNTNRNSKVYMEFYKSTRQLGIRFGNGINGRVPAVGDEIRLNVWMTQGETTLIDNQPLKFTGRFEPLNDSTKIITKTPITGGAPGESIEDTRNGALYSTSYDYQLAWDGDYVQFITDNVGGVIWLSVWGEKDEEAVTGKKDIANINKIFISAYSDRKDGDKLEGEINGLFSGRSGYNESYKFRQPVMQPYTVNIAGRVVANGRPEDAEIVLRSALVERYGINIKDKPFRVPVDEIWDFIHSLKQQANIREFTVTADNLPQEVTVGHYSYLDIDASTIKFTY